MGKENKVYSAVGASNIWMGIGTTIGTLVGGGIGFLAKRKAGIKNVEVPYLGTVEDVPGGVRGAAVGGLIGLAIGNAFGAIGGAIRGWKAAGKDEKALKASEVQIAELKGQIAGATDYLNHPAENAKSQVAMLEQRAQETAAGMAR